MSRIFTEIITVVIRSIDFLFLVGIAGSTIVLFMTFWEDLKTIVGKS